jgi:hypothetical protein
VRAGSALTLGEGDTSDDRRRREAVGRLVNSMVFYHDAPGSRPEALMVAEVRDVARMAAGWDLTARAEEEHGKASARLFESSPPSCEPITPRFEPSPQPLTHHTNPPARSQASIHSHMQRCT